MKRILVELAAQLVVLLVLFLLIAVGALFMGATTGAVASATAPDFHLQMADRLGLVCPRGQSVSIRHDRVVSGVDAHGRPYAGNSNDIYCTSQAEGTSRPLTDQEYVTAKLTTLVAAMAGYSLLCFVPLFVPLAILVCVVIHKIVGAVMKPAPPGPSFVSN